MRALVTHYYPRYPLQAEIFKLTSEHNRRVADKLGWSFFSDSLRRVPHLNVWREKSAILCDTFAQLADGDEVLWLDGDCLMVGEEIPEIFAAIAGYDYAMAKPFGRWNSGVVPMVVSPQIRELWREMRDHTHENVAKIGECSIVGDHRSIIQGASETWNANECADCPWPPEKRGPLCGSHKVKLVLLDTKWNQRPEDVNDDTQIIGFHRHNGFTKHRMILKVLEAGV